LGKADDAEKAFEAAMKLDTTDYTTPGELAKAAFAQKDYKKAAKYYTLVVDRMPKNKVRTQDMFNVGYAYYSDNDIAQAEEAFKRQIAFRPDGINGYEWAARTVMLADQNSEKGLAKPYLEKVVEIGAKDAAKYKEQLKLAYGYFAGFACAAKDAATATANATKLLELNPDSEQAKAILAGGCN
jgi:tetratricopeptide (TPR) repeat protein